MTEVTLTIVTECKFGERLTRGRQQSVGSSRCVKAFPENHGAEMGRHKGELVNKRRSVHGGGRAGLVKFQGSPERRGVRHIPMPEFTFIRAPGAHETQSVEVREGPDEWDEVCYIRLAILQPQLADGRQPAQAGPVTGVLQRYLGEVERSEVGEGGAMRVAVVQALQGACFLFQLDPRWPVSKVSDMTRRAVTSRSDSSAPRWEVIGRDFYSFEEVLSAALVPL